MPTQTEPVPGLLSPPTSVNSVRVPFDPEDQSDDEIVITSVYERQSGSSKAKDGKKNRSQDALGASKSKKPLSATAAPFNPQSPPVQVVHMLPPLVDVPSDWAKPKHDMACGFAYMGHGIEFCRWDMVTKYPVWFVGKVNSERIRPYFELNTLLKCQVWDLCYLWHPAQEKKDVSVLVVPTRQLELLLDRINQTLNLELAIPSGVNGDRFRFIFGEQGTPFPRFIGNPSDKTEFRSLVKAIPPSDPQDAVYDMPHITSQARTVYLKKIKSLLHDHGRGGRKKSKSEKAQKKRFSERQLWGSQAKRLQRYLGLRKKVAWADPHGLTHGLDDTFQAMGLKKAAPFGQEEDVMFVSMDIESYEYNHTAITEIGFAVLDARHTVGNPPGEHCENWHSLIQARHIRIREHASMVNRNFVHGCEGNFNFGTSEFVSVGDILSVITPVLQPGLPYCEPRQVVLVGHDIRSDISLVKNIGFYIEKGMFLEIVDTKDLHQHFRQQNQPLGLRTVLRDLEIEGRFLHNAGNDAVYTLQAMICLVVNARQNSLRRQKERLGQGYKPDLEVAEQGWDTGGEMSDGGPPKVDFEFKEASAKKSTIAAFHSEKQTIGQKSVPSTASEAPVLSPPLVPVSAVLGDLEDLIIF